MKFGVYLQMDTNKIRKKLEKNKAKASDNLLRSSVLLPIMDVKGESHLLFQVRSHNLKNQPGEICFPGGKMEPGETHRQSAIRETMEELNIQKKNIEIIGDLKPMITVFNMIIYPYCAILHDINFHDINYNREEVESIFTVPLSSLKKQNPLAHKLKVHTTPKDNFPYHLIQQGKDYNWGLRDYYIYFYTYKEYVIWGITARILKNFLDMIDS